MPSYTANKRPPGRGKGLYILSEDGSVGISLRMPAAMLKEIDHLLEGEIALFGSRQEFIRAAVENFIRSFDEDVSHKEKSAMGR